MRPIAILLLVGAASTASLAAENFKPLTGRDIHDRFSGMELGDETHWSFLFERDGTLASVSLGKPGSGSWRIEGDRLCMEGGPGTAGCYRVWMSGAAVQLRPEEAGALPEEGVLRKPGR